MNLTFDELLIRPHKAAPLEGHTVVVLERVGETGEKLHSVLEPGAERPRQSLTSSLLGKPDRYFAFAVDTSKGRSLSFTEHVETAERAHGFELHFSLWYRVADPRLLVSVRESDPLGTVRRKVAEVITGEIAELPWPDVWHSFRAASEFVVSGTLAGLKAFARDYGLAITSLRLRPTFPAGATEPDREIHGARERGWRGHERPVQRSQQSEIKVGGALKIENVPLLPDGDRLYRVWYATNRRPIDHGVRVGYGARLDDRVHFGSCDVAIPASHRMGELGSPWIRRFLSGTDDRLRLHEVVPMEAESFWTLVRHCAASFDAEHRHALVFLHGYRVSFKDAALRAAQLGYDLNVQGPVAFFSWPSRATLFGYPADGSAVEASEGAITDFLLQFVRNCGADRVHVIAHSMGNRPLLRALQRILSAAESEHAVRFGHLILAAPDVTRELFLDVADQYRRLSDRTTLYVSDEDRALRASFRLQGPRVGLAPPVTCVNGIDTVHVANVDRTLLGHSTFAEARPVLYDIHALLNFDAPPERRPGLIERREGKERYWEVRA
jgi:esterase/lipase superfamily enzyme